MDLAHGRCVGVFIPGDGDGAEDRVLAGLSPEEVAHVVSFGRQRRLTWVAGRVAMRAALARFGEVPVSIPADERGAPRLPPGVVGSISHKQALAIAMVAPDTGFTLGVDLETCEPARHDIGKRILTPAERDELGELGEHERGRAVKLRFSIKEAIYKAVDPFERRYVGFQEVEVTPLRGGGCQVRHRLLRVAEVEARWVEVQGNFIASARAR